MNKEFQLNKRIWQRVRFGDVVMEPKETAADLKAAWQASQAAEAHFKAVLEKFLA